MLAEEVETKSQIKKLFDKTTTASLTKKESAK